MATNFTIDEQYKLYLKRVALNEAQMHPEQRRQIKQTFFGAWGQALVHMRDEISELDEDAGIVVLEKQMQEVLDFFTAETNRHN